MVKYDRTFADSFVSGVATQEELDDLEYYRTVNSCPNIEVKDEDSIEATGWSLYIHEKGLASRIKGKITFTPFQWRALLRAILEADGDEVNDWSAVDLTMFLEESR